MTSKLVDEIEVIAKTAVWLAKEGYKLAAISIPKIQHMSPEEQKNYLITTLKSARCEPVELNFYSDGPDIIAEKEDICLKVECKGLGKGKSTTHRNNFDRALASVVSYYDGTDNIHLGLAFPDAPDYVRHLSKRVPDELRKTINIWIFLLSEDGQDLRVFSPESRFALVEREVLTPGIIAGLAKQLGITIEEAKATLQEQGMI